jgi:endogenous inhibitor of DNA gyrase (YacG/DUF329 family)
MAGRCPACKKVSQREGNKVFPFCSERCQLVDLGRWLGEEYRIADESVSPPTPKTSEDE